MNHNTPMKVSADVTAAELRDPDSLLSFYSGHSSWSFASATAHSYLFTLRHPHWTTYSRATMIAPPPRPSG